ncbi:hypothetical protein Mapa_015239 [Marchantia paleacea]|nr:hypothetical protein Mapa_015239 [Marchantia paleacea]
MVKRRRSVVNVEESRGFVASDESSKNRDQLHKDARMVFKAFSEEVANNLDTSEFGERPIVIEGIDNFYLLCDDRPISITELPLLINGDATFPSDSTKLIHLMGETRSGSGQIKLRAEMWKLWGLGSNFGPRISVKTSNGWARLHDPRPVYRRVMHDGLTLAHLLHYIEGNPDASSEEIETYLEKEFWKYRERPAMHKIPMFYSTVKCYLVKETEERRNGILSEIFPEQFYEERVAQDINLNKSITLHSDLDESHEGLEESHQEIRSFEYQHQDPNSSDNSTTTPPNLIADLKDTLETLREINRCENEVHKSVRDDLYELPPRSTTKLAPYLPYLSSNEAARAALEAENRLNEEDRNGSLTELSTDVITDDESELDQPSDVQGGKKKRGRPKKGRQVEGKPAKLDKNARLDDPPICIICDEGGDLLCCEGPCQRYFHAVEGLTGKESHCKTLGMTYREVKETIKFFCKNCRFQTQQCFICGELGSSAPSPILGHQEVFVCQASVCRRFYHPECVAMALIPTLDWKSLAEKIQRGQERFQCPRHACRVCHIEELNPGDLVQCRRCPKAWHYDCIQDYEFSKELPETEIWKHFRRKFVFCKDHKIVPKLQTPTRNHVRFPES